MQKAVLKQQFEAFTISSKESLEKGYDRFQKLLSQLDALGAGVSDEDANHKFLRSLPPAWDSLAMTMRTKKNIDTLSIDDLYNNLSVFEQDIQKTSSSSLTSDNVAFLSQAKASSSKHKPSHNSGSYSSYTTSSSKATPTATPGLADEVIHSFLATNADDVDLIHEDLDQIDDLDLEEMDINWQIAMTAIKIKKFYKKTGRRPRVDGKMHVAFDKRKVECFNCHNTGHFARECKFKSTKDGSRQEASRGQDFKPVRTEKEALMTIDEGQINWVEQTTDEEINHALMAFTVNNEGPQPQSPSPTQCLNAVPLFFSICPSDDMKWELGLCPNASSLLTPPTELEINNAKELVTIEKKRPKGSCLKSKGAFMLKFSNATPAWTNTNRVNKANQFTPRPVQLSHIRPNLSTVSRTVKTGRVNVNTGHANVSSGLEGREGSRASRFNTGKQHINSGSVHINTARVNRPGKMGTAVKTSAGCVWRKVIPLSNTNSGPTPESNVIVSRGPQGRPKPVKAWVLLKVLGNTTCILLMMKNVASSKGYTCLLAKASSDEAKLWHRRLSHLNFKNLNKLVKDNLVRGLPSKSSKEVHLIIDEQTEEVKELKWWFLLHLEKQLYLKTLLKRRLNSPKEAISTLISNEILIRSLKEALLLATMKTVSPSEEKKRDEVECPYKSHSEDSQCSSSKSNPWRSQYHLNKKEMRGVVVRNKASWYLQGHRQEEGIDYDEVFCAVARMKLSGNSKDFSISILSRGSSSTSSVNQTWDMDNPSTPGGCQFLGQRLNLPGNAKKNSYCSQLSTTKLNM
ncbi:ribonuclease H-like domain-containing protein [Tanacetum coccineum]